MRNLIIWVVLILAALASLAMPAHATSQRGLRTVTLQSAALGKSTTVTILLPDGYTTSAHRYPVLYLLHGSGQSSSDWSPSGVRRPLDPCTSYRRPLASPQ